MPNWAWPLFKFLDQWAGNPSNGLPQAADTEVVKIFRHLNSHQGTVTKRDLTGIRMRILSLSSLIQKPPSEADMSLYAEFEANFLMSVETLSSQGQH